MKGLFAISLLISLLSLTLSDDCKGGKLVLGKCYCPPGKN